jgi:2-methylcitrate dehydratase PrpD
MFFSLLHRRYIDFPPCVAQPVALRLHPAERCCIMSVVGTLANFVATANAAALPRAEQDLLRLHFTDTAVAALAGAHIAEGRALAAFTDPNALGAAIGRQAAAIRLTEIDDIHLPSCTTPSSAAFPVALAIAAQTGYFDLNRIASAMWVGTELMTRFGEAVRGPDVLYRGIWPTYLGAPIAAAATAARMWGLDAARTEHALSLACMLMAGGVGRIHGAPSGRWMLFANAVGAGVTAAQAARAGYRGDPALLDANWFADTHGTALDAGRLTDGLGRSSIYPRLSLKPFCSAKQGIAAIEAFRAIIASGVRSEDITRIRVRVPPAYSGMIATRAEPGARQSTLVSVAYQIALAAFAPEQLYDVDRSSTAVDDAITRLAAKVEIVADKDLAAFYPLHWPAEVEVEAGGKTKRHRVVEANGDPEHRLGRDGVDGKARRVLGPLVGAARADEWLAMSHATLENPGACRKLATVFASGF